MTSIKKARKIKYSANSRKSINSNDSLSLKLSDLRTTDLDNSLAQKPLQMSIVKNELKESISSVIANPFLPEPFILELKKSLRLVEHPAFN
jgi:hypothetical protein